MKKTFKVSSVSIRDGHATINGQFSVQGLPRKVLSRIPFTSLLNTTAIPVTREEANEFEPGRIYEATFELLPNPRPAVSSEEKMKQQEIFDLATEIAELIRARADSQAAINSTLRMVQGMFDYEELLSSSPESPQRLL